MIGAIIGDVVGSVYEFNNIRTKEFELIKKVISLFREPNDGCSMIDLYTRFIDSPSGKLG